MKNYRTICLLSVLNEIFIKITSNRIRHALEFNQPREQADSGRDILRSITPMSSIGQFRNLPSGINLSIWLSQIMKNAFDSVEIPGVMEALRNIKGCKGII